MFVSNTLLVSDVSNSDCFRHRTHWCSKSIFYHLKYEIIVDPVFIVNRNYFKMIS